MRYAEPVTILESGHNSRREMLYLVTSVFELVLEPGVGEGVPADAAVIYTGTPFVDASQNERDVLYIGLFIIVEPALIKVGCVAPNIGHGVTATFLSSGY